MDENKRTRRSFLQMGAAAAGAAALEQNSLANQATKPSSFLELVRVPDAVTVYERFEKTLPSAEHALKVSGERWQGGQIEVTTTTEQGSLVLTLSAPANPVAILHVRWRGQVLSNLLALGDAWERSYGELGWRDLIPERVMPWYFATWDGAICNGYGVKTDAAALCFWQLDPEGVSLWLNVTNGGNGVELGSRRLTMATVVAHRGDDGENPQQAVASLCRTMCARSARPVVPIYGANDWNYSYGNSTAQSILRDTDFLLELSPTGGVRPFSIIDGGWSNGTAAWPDMGVLAAEISRSTARPGIWIRPLEAPKDAPPGLVLPGARFGDNQDRAAEFAWDPTIPEAREKVRAKMREAVAWGYHMVKHDFSTYDLLGQWGFEMGAQPTVPGWSLHDRSRTNAEVISELYAMLRQAAGDSVLLDGCNTVAQLGQGFFDLQRTGDDTSGRQWERTRRMGVNTLSFRLPQQGTFHIVDADMVGITDAIPWEMNRQWLDALARSGTTTIVAAGPPARGAEQKAALREAYQLAAAGGAHARPADWFDTSTPERWQGQDETRRYRWSGAQGASPFLSA